MVRSTKSQACKSGVADSENRRSVNMKKTQAEGSELKRGWPSKKMMMARSGGVFSLDFLFIEQTHAAEAAKRVSHQSINTVRGPADANRYTSSEMSAVKMRRAKPRPHSLDQRIYKGNAEKSCAGSAVA